MLQLAVEADSSFALAWHRRALAAGWGASGPAGVFAARALQFVDSLRPVDRLLAEASHAFMFGDGVRAEAAARSAVANFPGNAEAWFWLASVRLHYRWQLGTTLGELREATDRVLAIDSLFQPAVSMATDQAITERRYDDARLLLPHAPTGGPGFGVARLGDRGVLAHVAGDEDERQRFWHELESVPAVWVWRAADRLLHTDSLDAAERVLHLVVSGDRAGDMVKRSEAVHLAHLPLARGQLRQARADFERAAELVPEVTAAQAILAALPFYERPRDELLTLRRDLESWSAPSPDEKVTTFGADLPNVLYPWIREYALGLLSARLRDSTMAHRYASLLDEASTPADSMGLRRDLAQDIRALLALEQSRPAEALRWLSDRPGRASFGEIFNYPLARRPIGRFLRAEALYQLQLYDQARRWFSTFERQLLTTEYVLFAPVYFRTAAIHEELGNPEAAREYYQRFVDRWSDADAQYQSLVAQARDRLAALTTGGSH